MGYEQPGRAAVLVRERLAVVGVHNPGLVVEQILQGEVRGVAAVAVRQHVLRGGLDVLEQRVEGDALPLGVELRPARHAVDVDGDRRARQLPELLPRPAPHLVDLALDGEVPVVGLGVGHRPGRQHREVAADIVLAGRQPARRPGAAPAGESSGDEGHGSQGRVKGGRSPRCTSARWTSFIVSMAAIARLRNPPATKRSSWVKRSSNAASTEAYVRSLMSSSRCSNESAAWRRVARNRSGGSGLGSGSCRPTKPSWWVVPASITLRRSSSWSPSNNGSVLTA